LRKLSTAEDTGHHDVVNCVHTEHPSNGEGIEGLDEGTKKKESGEEGG
jgi:hypothetical protein|tara:strand:- start:11491 stop:11634 length:144 start_codon:yes stop_codon:yes gene_type:complete